VSENTYEFLTKHGLPAALTSDSFKNNWPPRQESEEARRAIVVAHTTVARYAFPLATAASSASVQLG
jgi:hypothetical protein